MKRARLFLIITLAFSLRLYRLNSPLADWHSWRQADTSAVSRNFIKKGFDFLRPRFDDLSNVASGLGNLEGYRFVEFPIYNIFQAAAYKTFPFINLEIWGRLVSIFSSLGSLIFLYFIVDKYLEKKIALWTVFFFAVLPFNIYYSRVILPESMMLMVSLGMIYFFSQWFDINSRKDLILAIIFAAASFLLKPYTLVLLLPITYLAWRKWHFSWRKWPILVFCLFVSLLPFLMWRIWMQRFPEGIPFYYWLFNESGIRFKGAFFWWLFSERIGKLILGGWGLILLGFGLALKPSKKEGLFFFSWLVAILTYFIIIAGGNVQHDYYQVISVPIICVFLAKGAHFLSTTSKELFSRFLCYLLLVISILFMLAFSWYQIRDFFNINNPAIIKAGKAADRLLPQNAKVIAPYGGDTAFLYQTNRQGWPIGFEIEKMIEEGAEYYINVNFELETEWVLGNYCLLEKTDDWVIVDLQRKCDSDQ